MKKNLPISQKKKFKYSITFQSFDEESLEAGDSFDRGYEVEDTIDLIGDILYKAYSTYGIYMPVAFGTWESTNPLENTDFYEKGIQKYFAIHITNEDGTQISQEENDFITFILSDGNYELNKFREYAVGGVVLGSIALGIGALITYFYFKGKKGNKNGSSNNRAKSVTHTINGKDRKFPIKDAWRKEHSLENQSEDYEVPQEKRFEMGGYASEHYHEIEYGEGGVAKAKEIIMNKIGFNEENANYLVSQSEKFSIWLADAILKQEITRLNDLEKSSYVKNIIDKKATLDFINKRNNHIQYGYSTPIREILDWLKHPITPKQDLKQLSFDQALIKSREWHNELQVLGGDIDYTEPETNTILKKYPVNSDGIEYYWVFIPSNYCKLEGSRMGHCGTTGLRNNLISLRSIKPYEKEHTINDSHILIAYGVDDGIFYQVKGKKNSKPAEKYFPYIFDLIKSAIKDNDIKYSKTSNKFDKNNKLTKEEKVLEFNGFGSEYGQEEDYGFEEMTKEQIREIFDLKPTLFESGEDNLMLFDKGVITLDEFKKIIKDNDNLFGFAEDYYMFLEKDVITLDELKEIVERKPDVFSSFGNQMNLYEKGIITEQPSTTFELKYDCDDVYRLLDISRDFRDDLVAQVLCGDVGELSDGWSYYYDNPSDLVNNLNKENEQKVIDEIVRITKLDESIVKENGIEYYLNGDDENFSPNDDFDNIIRSLASAQNQADNNDYYNYLYKAIESALNELGEVHSLNDEGVKMTIDLSNSMSLQEIAEKMDYYEFTDVEDLFKEKIGEEIDTPFLSIDDRYSPYGSSEDFNEYISDTDLEQGYKKGGVLRTKNISTNKKIKNMKSTENKFADGGQIIRFDRHASMDSATRNELVEMTSYPFLLEYEVEENGQIKYDRIKSELKREGVSTEMIKNYLSGLFDGYNYSNTDAFKKEMAKLKLVDKEFYDKVMMLYEKISKYPKINVEYADGGRVTTNDGIIESFLTSNKQLKVGNLSTHFNQYDNQMLLRNYGTLIATRIGNDVSITNIKYSKTTTTITNKIRNMALQKRMNISYVDKFAEGGETQKVNLGNGEMDLDEAIKIYEEKIKAQGRVVNARDEDVLEQLKRMKNKYADGGEIKEWENSMKKRNDIEFLRIEKTEALPNNKLMVYYAYNPIGKDEFKGTQISTDVIKFAGGGKTGKYSIIVWETEEDRDAGESFVAEIFTNKQEALEKAEKMYYKQDFSAIEVIDENDEVILHLSSNEEEDYAKGGMIEHGLREGDRIIANKLNDEDSIYVIDKKRQAHEVNLNEGIRFADGGEAGNTFVNILLDYGFVEKRSAYGVRHFYNKSKDFYASLDDKLRTLDVYKNDDMVVQGREYRGYSIQELINFLNTKRFTSGNKFADGGSVDLDYADILNVLKTKIDASIDEMPMDYENANSFTGEEVEHESRSGFIPYTDGGYQAVWFEYLSGMWGAGRNLPTKVLDVEMNRQIDYNLDTAKESFVDEFPEIVEKLGLENIDYHSLYEAGYGEEAEMLSNAEMEMMGEDTIMMQVCAYYYTPENSRGFEGENTIRLFGDVNLESPYHRAGNLDDTYEVEFAFSSISELEQKMDKGIAKIISWFNGNMYNESTAEMKIRRMAEGGKTGEKSTKKRTIKKRPKTREPKMVRQYFDDRPYSYAEGGKAGAVSKTKIQITDGEEGRKIATRTLIKENKNGERITYELLVGVFKDKKKGYFEIYATDSDDDEYFYAEGGLWIEGGRVVDYDGVYELSEKLKPLMSALNLNSVDVFAEGGETGEDDNYDDKYAEGGKTDSYKFFDVYDKKTDKTLKIKAESLADAKIYAEESIDFNEYKDGEKINLFDWFWNYDYRHYLRDASPKQRNIVKQKFIEKGLELDASSPKHAYIVVSTIKPSELTLFKKVGSDGIKFAEGGKVDILGLYKKDVFSEKDSELIDEAIENGDIDTTDIKEDFIGYVYDRIDEEYKDNKFETEQIWEYTDEYYENGLPHKENYKKLISYLNNEDEEGFAEGGEVSEWMEQALDSLIKETGNEDLDITMVSNNGNEFFAGNDMEEYRVFKTEEDAEQEAIEQVRDDLQESPENFNQDFIKNYIDGRDFFEAELNEMNYMYVEDISSETSGTKYNNRLIDELVENGLMDEDDAILENAEEIADELKYDYVLLLTEEKLDEGNDGLDYFINNFGENETYGMVVDNNLIDIDKASQDAVDIDGIAHFISSYDGRTLYLLNNNVAYRNN